ncbi:MAG: beta-ACP synthase [Rhodobacterales bacterium]|nr:MAG: beta-ACP synthase [Rhodobacterales bacterium]
MRRVVITGAGTINALGRDVAETCDAFKAGRSGIVELQFEDSDRLSIRQGAQVQGYDPTAYFDRQQIALFDRYTQFALLAAEQAIAQSGLTFEGALAERAGAVLGNSGGGLITQNDAFRAVFAEGKNRVHPFTVPKLMNNAAASHISMQHNLRGPTFTVSTACASANHAMGQAFSMIRSGMSEVMLTGGAESMLCFGGIKAWEGLRVMTHDAMRPFSANRSGMLQGEGAAVFVFEELEHARARGAEILAEVAGFAMSADASDIVKPARHGPVRAIAGALKDARLDPSEVGYINAHGTATEINDRVECAAIAEVFGPAAQQVMLSSTKAMHGHVIGGTGAIELLACLLALGGGVIAPTINYQQPDPNCPLDVVPNEARQAPVTAVLSNAFAFGGLNAVLALRKAP